MSDTRQEAQKNLSENMEDALGSSLSTSFSPSPPPPQPSAPESVNVLGSEALSEPAPPRPEDQVEGLDTWQQTYDSYVEHWQAESKVAREKALAIRTALEKETEAKEKAIKDQAAAERKARKEQEEAERRKRKLEEELSEAGPSKKSDVGKSKAAGAERGRKVKEAWEMVKGDTPAGSGSAEAVGSVVDGRGVTDADIRAGQAIPAGEHRPQHVSKGYDPTTSKDPLPPSLQDTAPSFPSLALPQSSATSRHSATSQAWEEISATPSSAEDLSPPRSSSDRSGEEMMSVPRSSNAVGQAATDPVPSAITPSGLSRPDSAATAPTAPDPGASAPNPPPAQPPSLTLSIFTMPSHLSFGRVMAVIGINLVLPFVNGIMLGFGEIFAREIIKVSRIAWREGRGVFGLGSWFRGSSSSGAGRVGLSGRF